MQTLQSHSHTHTNTHMHRTTLLFAYRTSHWRSSGDVRTIFSVIKMLCRCVDDVDSFCPNPASQLTITTHARTHIRVFNSIRGRCGGTKRDQPRTVRRIYHQFPLPLQVRHQVAGPSIRLPLRSTRREVSAVRKKRGAVVFRLLPHSHVASLVYKTGAPVASH